MPVPIALGVAALLLSSLQPFPRAQSWLLEVFQPGGMCLSAVPVGCHVPTSLALCSAALPDWPAPTRPSRSGKRGTKAASPQPHTSAAGNGDSMLYHGQKPAQDTDSIRDGRPRDSLLGHGSEAHASRDTKCISWSPTTARSPPWQPEVPGVHRWAQRARAELTAKTPGTVTLAFSAREPEQLIWKVMNLQEGQLWGE